MRLNERLMSAGAWKYSEDRSVKTIKECAAAIPSSAFLAVAAGATALSFGLLVSGRKNWGNFIATWVPIWLIIGLYKKLAQMEEHDRQDRSR
ncbi:MAG: hypothetical protein ACREQ7_25255 [Candidatus Binatia bacterium]